MNKRTRFVILAVTAPVLAYTLVGGILDRVSAREDTYRYLRIFEDVVSLVSDNYVEQVDPASIMHGALWGLAEGLDPQSSYLTPDEVRQYDGGSGTPTDSIGLVLTRRYYIQVVAARDGSPADKAGLQPGDFIREIDGQPTRMMSTVQAYTLLRGADGSVLDLSVIRDNAAEPVDVSLTRNSTKSANVTSRFVGPGIGYLRIAEFDQMTAAAITSASNQLARQGAQQFLVDLRDTALGPFEAGIAVAELFTHAEPLAIRKSASAQEPVGRSEQEPPSITSPVVILTNHGTAGAAELFAAVLTGTSQAESIGVRTAGRAAEQTLVRLPDGGGLLLSSTEYLTASGDSIHRTGVEPTVTVEEPALELLLTPSAPQEDPILDRALQHIVGMTATQ